MAKRGLTNKQKRFVEEYMIDLNAKQAAIRTGYSEKTAAQQASRLLNNVNVADALNKAKRKASEKMEITFDDCVRGLHGITEEDDAPAAARKSAWETLAKMCGHWVEQRKVTHEGEVTHKHELSEPAKDKLKEIYEAGKQETSA